MLDTFYTILQLLARLSGFDSWLAFFVVVFTDRVTYADSAAPWQAPVEVEEED